MMNDIKTRLWSGIVIPLKNRTCLQIKPFFKKRWSKLYKFLYFVDRAVYKIWLSSRDGACILTLFERKSEGEYDEDIIVFGCFRRVSCAKCRRSAGRAVGLS